MQNTSQGGAFDAEVEIKLARRTYQHFRDLILNILEAAKTDPPSDDTAKAIGQASKSYQAALLQLSKQEADLEKHRQCIAGVVPGGALDLNAARAEILARLARHRDAAGN